MDIIRGYEIERKLHSGKNYNIYSAVRNSDNLKLIIKTPLDKYKTQIPVLRLSNEYETGKVFDHKNIVRYVEFIETDTKPLLISEYFEGIKLSNYIPENGLGLETFLIIAIQIAEGLAEIHSKNIIHQLIKPSNILINKKTRQIKIYDFAKATYNNYHIKGDYNNFKDSIEYISPEQTGRINRNADYRTDFYSLGITFYEMLTGRLPFEVKDILEMIHWHIAKKADAPHIVNDSVPHIISDIIIKLLDKNVSKRYQSAEGLKYDLEYFYNNLSDLKAKKLKNFEIAQKDFSGEFKIPQKLYGRENEIQQSHEQFNKVCKGDTVILMVTGYSGIGKSAIVNELQKEITINDAYFATGKYEHLKKNIAYSAIASGFKDLIKQILGKNDTEIMVWKEKLLKALGVNGQLIIDIIPDLELIIGKQPPAPMIGSSDTQNRFNIVFQNFVSVFDQMAHPLIIFLDDLQWIDLASLNLIKLITSEHLTKSFLFIGAYRSNEVDESHPVITTVEDIKKTGVDVQYINLQPLNLDSINCWVADTLDCSLNKAKEISTLISQKTNGNPFFIKSFLQNLYRENLIRYEGKGVWDWNLNEIIAKKPTDNVTILMAENIKKLPAESREIIMSASCIGISFKNRNLSYISKKTEYEVEKLLHPVLDSGMIFKFQGTYKFIHDKVLEAAYFLIPEDMKPQKHLLTGRLLIQNYSNQEIDENLFSIAEHFNKGISLINDDDEIYELLKLNVRVAQKAKSSAAYRNAGYYYKIASSLLHENSWKENYEFTLDIYSGWAEVEHMSTNFEKAGELFNIVLENAKTILDKSRIYQLIFIYHENTGKFREAVDLAIEIINDLGISFPHPKKIDEETKNKQIDRFLKNIGDREIESLIDLPDISDSLHTEAIGILVSVLVPYWNTYPDILPYMTYEIVNLSIEKGLCPVAAIGFSTLGSILAMDSKTNDTGYKLAKLAIAITDKFENKFYETSSKYMLYNHAHFWKKPLRWKRDKLIEAYHIGIDAGNTQWASYCVNHYCMRFLLAGDNLESAKKQYDTFTDSIHILRQETSLTYFNPPKQAVYNLLGLAKDKYLIKGDAFNEELDFQKFHTTKQFPAIGLFNICKLLIFIVFGEYEKSLKIVSETNFEDYVRANAGQFQPYLGLCFYGITLMQNYEKVSMDKQEKYLDKTIGLSREFKNYADLNHLNFAPMYYILTAEVKRIKNEYSEAIDFYDKAVQSAEENSYLHLQGIINELIASFWKKRGKGRISEAYIYDAYLCYKKWGCTPKSEILENEYPHLFLHEMQNKTVPDESFTILDIDSVQKATQTISSEIVTDELLSKLMEIIIENTGAQKGYIVLKQKTTLSIVSGFNVESKKKEIFIDENLENTNLLSEKIIRYVVRTGENIILQNACFEGQFIKDSYIKNNSSKSVLAMPILNKKKVQGALFLENNLNTNVFSDERIKHLNIILSQAAISLENAKLFNEIVQAEKELRKKDFIIRSASSTISTATLEGIVTYVNPTFLKLWKYDSPEDVIGLHFSDLWMVNDRVDEIMGSLLGKGRKWSGEIKAKRKDGTLFDVLVSAATVLDDNGNPIALMSTSIDITKSKQAEEELHRLRNYMSNIIDSMPSVLVGVDSEGKVTQWNAEAQRSTGISPIDAEGQPLEIVIPRLYDEMEQVRNAMQSHEVYFDPRRCRNDKDGKRYEDVTVYPLISNSEVGAVIRIDDTTEHVQMEEMMIQSEKMLSVGGLAAGMAHEINNPLAGIMQIADVINKRLTNLEMPANQRVAKEIGISMKNIHSFMEARGIISMLEIINESGIRATQIVSNMLSFARKSNSFQSHNLVDLLDQTVDMAGSDYDLKKKFDFRQIKIVREYEDNLPEIPCEAGKIQQVLFNILRNGADAIQEAIEKDDSKKPYFILRLAHEVSANKIRMEIEDSGTGMTDATLKRVFEPFFTTKPTGVGTGLGLSVSYFIITENHRGEMSVKSTPGKGTTFIIKLPLDT
ncbi:MAG: AAA family ATPase [Desulfobacterales bacterium]|nr:AAA family ATPase [Desulfobacterales bacterium]